MDAPTLKTFTDIINFGTSFRYEYDVVKKHLASSIERFEKYIWIETLTPATPPEGGWTEEVPDPGPTSTWGWHPNVNIMYSESEKLVLKEYYDTLKEDLNFYETFAITHADVVSLMFDPTPKVDMLLGSALSGIVAG